jgi:acetylornithine deacetylase
MTTAADHLLNLIRIPSVSSSSNREVIEYARHALCLAGWSTREVMYLDENRIEKVNLIAAPPQQDVADHLVDLAFVCHTDTVPFASSWKDALSPTFKDGRIYGCGACDVKGFLACLLQAAASPIPGRWIEGLRIVLTADEEIGCLGAKHLLACDALRPKRLVIGEPTSLHVARAGKGYCLSEIVVCGTEAHSAHPDQGASAIYAASRLIRSIELLAEALAKETHELFSPSFTSLNIGTIQGGTAKNIIPGECRFLIEWRPVPGLSASRIPDALQAFADDLQLQDSPLKVTIHHLRQQAGFETPPDASLVESLVRLTGRHATSIPFGSEASLFAPVAEQTVVFGPGDMRTAHSDREVVSVAELDEAVTVLKRLMTQIID